MDHRRSALIHTHIHTYKRTSDHQSYCKPCLHCRNRRTTCSSLRCLHDVWITVVSCECLACAANTFSTWPARPSGHLANHIAIALSWFVSLSDLFACCTQNKSFWSLWDSLHRLGRIYHIKRHVISAICSHRHTWMSSLFIINSVHLIRPIMCHCPTSATYHGCALAPIHWVQHKWDPQHCLLYVPLCAFWWRTTWCEFGPRLSAVTSNCRPLIIEIGCHVWCTKWQLNQW